MKSFNLTHHYSTFQEPSHPKIVSLTSSPLSPSSSSSSSPSLIASKSLEEEAASRSSRRRLMLLTNSVVISTALYPLFSSSASSLSSTNSITPNDGRVVTEFAQLPNSGGVKSLDLRLGTGSTPVDGDQVAIHYYGRLAAKQGWRFDSTYDHKDFTGESIPFTFILGSDNVISGIQVSVRSMKVGGIRRVIIPPSQGYQDTTQQPLPPDFFDRQRLFTTIFNPTRLANGEGSTLGTLIFDIELVSVKH